MRVVDQGDLGTQMLRDLHVPEQFWTDELSENIWYLVRRIVQDPQGVFTRFGRLSNAELKRFTLTKEEKEILINRYSLDGKQPPLKVRTLKELAGDQEDFVNRNRHRRYLKDFNFAQIVVQRILERLLYMIPPDLKEKRAP